MVFLGLFFWNTGGNIDHGLPSDLCSCLSLCLCIFFVDVGDMMVVV